MPPVGFEPTISAGERPKTYALDRAATGIRSPDRPARRQSLYWLSYPAPFEMSQIQKVMICDIGMDKLR